LRVNKQDLVDVVAETGELPKAKAGEVLSAVFVAIEAALKKSEEVRLVGFGTFSTSQRKAGKGRNPRTGEEIAIPASTTVRFKAGKGLKESVSVAATKGKGGKKPAAKAKGA
jgi:DNA-binding protein HU-beta